MLELYTALYSRCGRKEYKACERLRARSNAHDHVVAHTNPSVVFCCWLCWLNAAAVLPPDQQVHSPALQTYSCCFTIIRQLTLLLPQLLFSFAR